MSPVVSHTLTWEEGEVPVSERFADTFYSRSDGRAEAAHVFLGGNELPSRLSQNSNFMIAELGFGTGLNFLETWRGWSDVRRPGQMLRFVSFEAFPIDADDMQRALLRWPELTFLSSRLVDRWRQDGKQDGSACGWLMDQQTELCVHFGDAGQQLPSWAGRADAWFLDGFAPSRNADMWSPGLMAEVFSHTLPGGSFATYTAAGWVRRNLIAAGFAVEKRPGFAGKREMMRGVRPGQ
ncbi:MAG: tRNA (5-methylaminomethyl-2-thiouridine)(34)-methyltransferase MnmD [Alphaproteobacteria bacterium]|nr:tRNA (5-methylaminomethyl-2-thiouridine)(34)-methyltransferase MnmD [Alphaproteobacteria bacterium]